MAHAATVVSPTSGSGSATGPFTISFANPGPQGDNGMGMFTTSGIVTNSMGLTSSGTPSVFVIEPQTGVGGSNAVNSIAFSLPITSGAFTLTFGANTTGPISYNANPNTLASNIQNAINVAPVSLAGKATVSSAGGGTFFITYGGADANLPEAPPTVNYNSLASAGPYITTQTTAIGTTGTQAVQQLNFGSFTAGATYTLSFGASTSSTQTLSGGDDSAAILGVLNGLPSVVLAGGVSSVAAVAGSGFSQYNVTFTAKMVQSSAITINVLTPSTATIPANTIVAGVAPASAVQTLTLVNPPTGGTFTLSYGGFTTGPIAIVNNNGAAIAANIQQALNDLPSVGGLANPGSVIVFSSSATVFTLSFGASLANQPIALVGSSAVGLLAAQNTAIATVVTTAPGGATVSDHQTLTFAGPISGGNFTLTFNNTVFGGSSQTTSVINWSCQTPRHWPPTSRTH